MTSTEAQPSGPRTSSQRVSDNTIGQRLIELVTSYVPPAIIGALIVFAAFAPWSWPANGIVPDGGDTLWVQAMAEVHGQAGPFAADPHFGWPIGLSPWSHPQLGLFFGIVTWMAGSLGVGSALAGLIALASAASLISIGTTFFLRGVLGARFKIAVAVASVLFAASPFVLQKYGHFGVAAYFLLPMVLGIAVRRFRSMRQRVVLVALVSVAALLSPAWWIVVSGLVLGVVFVLALLTFRWPGAITTALALIPCGMGVVFQVFMQRTFSEPSTVTTRLAWDSNVLGGHLVDFFTGSPFLNSILPLQDRLAAGLSVEPSPIGLVLTIAGALAVFLVLAVFPGQIAVRDRTYTLRMLTTTSLTLFVVGGLGNLQAGLAVLLGGSSPARVWSRMVILLALIGMAWALVAIRDTTFGGRLRNPAIAIPGLVVVSMLALLDGRASTVVKPQAQESFSEYAPVSYLRSTLEPCPIAQLPQDDFPLPRVEDPENFATFVPNLYYRPFIPYLMAPEFFWSYGSWSGKTDNGLRDVPVKMTDASLASMKARGFCAVLYDEALAVHARKTNVKLEGRDLALTISPDFLDGRYSVYILR